MEYKKTFDLIVNELDFSGKKMKAIRKEKKKSLEEISNQINISGATLFRLENNLVKKISIKVIKQLANLYKISYTYFYGNKSTPILETITGIVFLFINGVSIEKIYTDNEVSKKIGYLEYKVLEKYFKKAESENRKESLYEELTEDEKEEYKTFKIMNLSFLKTEQIFSKNEIEENEVLLFSYYFAHKVKREII